MLHCRVNQLQLKAWNQAIFYKAIFFQPSACFKQCICKAQLPLMCFQACRHSIQSSQKADKGNQPRLQLGTGTCTQLLKLYRMNKYPWVSESSLSGHWTQDFWTQDFWTQDFWTQDFQTPPQLSLSSSCFANNGAALESSKVGYACALSMNWPPTQNFAQEPLMCIVLYLQSQVGCKFMQASQLSLISCTVSVLKCIN